MKQLKIPMGQYRGWQTYWCPFQERKWHASKGLELIMEKTNMKMLELVDFRESDQWDANDDPARRHKKQEQKWRNREQQINDKKGN